MQAVMWIDLHPRKQDMPLSEYLDHYLNVHGAIALAGQLVQIRRYVQNHRVEPLPIALEKLGLGDHGIDSAAQIWLDDKSALLDMIALPGAQALLADERNFMDLGRPRSPTLLEEDHLDGIPRGIRPDGLKLLVAARRSAGQSFEAFRASWSTAVDLDAVRAVGATRHIASLPPHAFDFEDAQVERTADARGPIDGVREIWFPSLDVMTRSAVDCPDLWRTMIAPDGVDRARSDAVIVQEHILISDPKPTYDKEVLQGGPA